MAEPTQGPLYLCGSSVETGLRVLGTGTNTCNLDHSFLSETGRGEGSGTTGTETITQTFWRMERLQLQDLKNLTVMKSWGPREPHFLPCHDPGKLRTGPLWE